MLSKVKHCLIPVQLVTEYAASYPRNVFTSVVTLDEYKNAPKNYPHPSEIPAGDPSHLAYHCFILLFSFRKPIDSC